MAHHSRVSKVLIDVAPLDRDRGLAFWQAAVGGRWTAPPPRDITELIWIFTPTVLPGKDFELSVQQLGEGSSRLHLEEEVERLARLGARRVRQRDDLWVMQDPAGFLLCDP